MLAADGLGDRDLTPLLRVVPRGSCLGSLLRTSKLKDNQGKVYFEVTYKLTLEKENKMTYSYLP